MTQHRDRSTTRRAAIAATLGVGMIALALPQARLFATSSAAQPGVLSGARAMLVSGRIISPAGAQTTLWNLPMNAVLSPNGKQLLVANAGAYDPEMLQVVDTATHQVVQDLPFRSPASVSFGKNITPNLHALVTRFGVLDNFYADAEVSADGHNWINGAYASDYNEKMWPIDYSWGLVYRNRGYDFEGDSLVNNNPGGYLWDTAHDAGITYRDYGDFYRFLSQGYILKNGKVISANAPATACPGPIAHTIIAPPKGVTLPAGAAFCYPAESVNPVTEPNLVGHIDPRYREFDLHFSEADRYAEWKREFDQFVANGNLPAFELLRIPNDHTEGTSARYLTPRAYVASNDQYVGQVVDAVSHSPYWKDTLIVVTEDDAQNGPDHVDGHRTTSLVISAYNSHSSLTVDHTLYDTAAMVRTVELVLGLHPLSQYDAQATPMWRLFNSTPDLTPYSVAPENISIAETNTIAAPSAHVSATLNFAQEDRAPAPVLNRIIWQSVKGARAQYPVSHYSRLGASDDK
jgi:hypothetical protein